MKNAPLAEILPIVVGAAPDGRIVGKIRLQKVFYLLDKLGLGVNLKFSYHHYGPYSDDLSNAIDFAHHFNTAFEETQQSAQSHSGKYSVFTSTETPSSDFSLGDIDQPNLTELLKKMTSTSSVVIELAATIHWLQNVEKVADWESTLKARKPSKTSPENVKKAKALLDEIELAA